MTANLSVAIREIPGVKQYRIIQNEIEDITLQLVTDLKHDEQIRSLFQKHLGYLPARLRIEYVSDIPRGPGGKFRTTINNIPNMGGAR